MERDLFWRREVSRKRILYGFLWIVWAGFWQVIAHERLGWPAVLTFGALIILPVLYNKVTNWWMETSGCLSFVLFGFAGGIGMWLWSLTSPAFQYDSTSLGLIDLGLFWGYIGVAIGKTYMTLEAHYNEHNFTPLMLCCLKKDYDWRWWVDSHYALIRSGSPLPTEIKEAPTRSGG